MSKKIFLTSLLTIALLSLCLSSAYAQESATSAEEEISLDETVKASDLEISEPTILPDSPFYFLKNWQRAIKEAFTFGSVQKAEVRLEHASERLLEMEKLAEKTDNPEILEKATEKYEESIEKIKEITEKIEDKADVNERVDEFLDKFVKQQTLHQRVLEKLEEQVPTGVLEKIRQTREEHLENFGQVMEKLENKERIAERLEKNLEELEGSDFKEFKNAELLKNLAEKSPEEIKEQIEEAQENRLNILKEKLEIMPLQTQEKFQNYVENISGNAETKVEVLEKVRQRVMEKVEIRERLENSSQKIINRINENNQEVMSLAEAMEIAKNSQCGQNGVLTSNAFYNENSNTWWIDLDVYDRVWQQRSVSKNTCNPACVVNVRTKTAEINWRCTGLITPNSTSETNIRSNSYKAQ